MDRMISPALKPHLLLLAIGVSGCSTINTVSKETLPKDNSDAIHIILVDDREIDFEPGDYSIFRRSDSSFIYGVGVMVGRSHEDTTQFIGRIYIQEIKNYQVDGSSEGDGSAALTQVGTAAGVFVLTLLALAIILSGSGGPF